MLGWDLGGSPSSQHGLTGAEASLASMSKGKSTQSMDTPPPP